MQTFLIVLTICVCTLLNACEAVSKPSDEAVKSVAALCEKHNQSVKVYYTTSSVRIECEGLID